MISAQWKSDKMTDGFAVLTSSKNCWDGVSE